jgi:hypothetical protein
VVAVKGPVRRVLVIITLTIEGVEVGLERVTLGFNSTRVYGRLSSGHRLLSTEDGGDRRDQTSGGRRGRGRRRRFLGVLSLGDLLLDRVFFVLPADKVGDLRQRAQIR